MMRARRESGTAAIELVVVLVTGMTIAAAVTLLGRMTWHMIAIEKSVSNTARIIAALPRETRTSANAGTDIPARARALILDATASAGIDIRPASGSILAMCGMLACGEGGNPDVFNISANIGFYDTMLRPYTQYIIRGNSKQSINSIHSESCAPPSPTLP